MDYTIISTGSTGNAVILWIDEDNGIMVDCGVSFKALKDVYRKIQLVLLTHRHSDHLNKATLKRLINERPLLRIGCASHLLDELVTDCRIDPHLIDVYAYGLNYEYLRQSYSVEAFPVPHNVSNNGYLVTINGEKIFYATDAGNLDHINAPGCDMYFIEANYGEAEIQDRISEKKLNGEFAYERDVLTNHLSYEQAMDFLIRNNTKNADYVLLHGHIDKE